MFQAIKIKREVNKTRNPKIQNEITKTKTLQNIQISNQEFNPTHQSISHPKTKLFQHNN